MCITFQHVIRRPVNNTLKLRLPQKFPTVLFNKPIYLVIVVARMLFLTDPSNCKAGLLSPYCYRDFSAVFLPSYSRIRYSRHQFQFHGRYFGVSKVVISDGGIRKLGAAGLLKDDSFF